MSFHLFYLPSKIKTLLLLKTWLFLQLLFCSLMFLCKNWTCLSGFFHHSTCIFYLMHTIIHLYFTSKPLVTSVVTWSWQTSRNIWRLTWRTFHERTGLKFILGLTISTTICFWVSTLTLNILPSTHSAAHNDKAYKLPPNTEQSND